MVQAFNFAGEVYVHHCTPSGKSYVGQTTAGMLRRWRLHLRGARSSKTPAYRNLFSKAIRKYGSAGFDSQVLSRATSQSELDNLEKIWIILLQTKAPNGYNLTDGGNSGTVGHVVSPEVRARLSLAAKSQWKNPEFRRQYSELRRGRKQPADSVEARAQKLRGRKQSAEIIANRVAKLKGKKRTQEYRDQCASRMLGRKLSDVTKAKMSASQKARAERGRNNGS